MDLRIECADRQLRDVGCHKSAVVVAGLSDDIAAVAEHLTVKGWCQDEEDWLCPRCNFLRRQKAFTAAIMQTRAKEIEQDSLALGISTDLSLPDQVVAQAEAFCSVSD